MLLETAAFSSFPRAVSSLPVIEEVFEAAGLPIPPGPAPREIVLEAVRDAQRDGASGRTDTATDDALAVCATPGAIVSVLAVSADQALVIVTDAKGEQRVSRDDSPSARRRKSRWDDDVMRSGSESRRLGRDTSGRRDMPAQSDPLCATPPRRATECMTPTQHALADGAAYRSSIIDVHVLLTAGDEVLLTLRRDRHPDFDRRWQLPCGKVRRDESALVGAVREAHEEVGVRIDPAHLRHVHTMHITNIGDASRVGLFFSTPVWHGEPENREPQNCSAVAWFPLNALPTPMVDFTHAALQAHREGVAFAVFDWGRRRGTRHQMEDT